MLIGLTGFAGSGKTTLAQAMGDHVLSFANPLRDLMAHLDPILVMERTEQWAPLSAWVARGLSYPLLKRETDLRDFMVRLGEGAREHLGPDVWVRAMEHQLSKVDPDTTHVVIDDIRYTNEVEFVERNAGVVFLVQREGVTAANKEEERSISDLLHRRGVSGVIENDGTVEEMVAKAEAFGHQIRRRHLRSV